MKLVTRSALLAVVCLWLAPSLAAAEAARGHLVGTDWLSARLGDPNLVLLDASPRQLYAAKHIPGALSTDFLTYGFPERPLADMETRYQSWGLSPGKTVVVYDQGGTFMATRLFFALYYHGFPADDLLVLDGGLAKWQERGLPVTQEVPAAPAKGAFTITAVREDARIRLPEFLTASGDTVNNALVDAVGPDWHYGEVRFFSRSGHIPNALLMPSADFFNPDKTFKSPDEIRRMAMHLGIRPGQRIHTHCGGGVAASVPFFALKFLLGYPNVTLFQESQMGWLADDRELPYWTYGAPYLIRDPRWLNGWGGQALRSFGASNVSIVDVRAASVFDQGHVPFALNVPAEVFRRHVAAPEKLAEILGPAAVNPSHEAIVVSGGGLTPDAALAFVMLENLGQKRVSLLLESMDAWAQQGLPVTKDATVVGPRSAQQPLAIPAAAYPANVRTGVLVAGGAAPTRDESPTLFVASGANLPAKVPDGTIVHVPYSSLLNADGTPKAAKDIWNLLSKAGVSRYASLVCVSDDPGEAAANYVLLKLMGFAGVKVLAP